MNKLLYISFLFPPIGGSGVQRSLKFARHLPDFEWEPIVLCADHRFLKQPKDYSLTSDISCKVYSCFSPDIRWLYKLMWGLRLHKLVNIINRNLMLPDPEVVFLPFAKLAIRKLLKTHKIDLVLITAPPYSALFLGAYIKKLFGIDYCIDYRDLWVLGVARADNPPSKKVQALEYRWEAEIIAGARQVVCVNSLMTTKLVAKYPNLLIDKVTGITNGYDEADFVDIPQYKRQTKMNVVFTGSLYDRFQPDIIWEAISNLIDSGLIMREDISVNIYGKNNPAFVLGKYAISEHISKIVNIHPYLTHRNSIMRICAADALLLFSPSGKHSDTDSHSKLFEYMRSYRPILAVINPDSIGADILKPCGTCVLADSGSLSAIQDALLQLYSAWKNDQQSLQPDYEYIATYERKALTAKLAEVLDKAMVDKN